MRTSSFSSTKFRQPSFFLNVRNHNVNPGERGTYGNKSGDLLSVLNELHTHALADGRVGLFGFDANLLEDDALCVGGTSSRRCFVDVAESAFFVGFICLETRLECQDIIK
jgi:hypothetical protein